MAGFNEESIPDQSGRCIVVTGANAGIGWEAARALASKGARVLLGCRSAAKAEAAIVRIRAQVPTADLVHLPLDLADFASIRAAVHIAAAEPRIDVLLNNAGVMVNSFMTTAQGFEAHFGVNYLGAFALTSLLLPKLAEAPGARVVSTSSLSYRFAAGDYAHINGEDGFRPMQRYASSKLAILAFTMELDRRLRAAQSPVTALACHPGFAATEIMGPSVGVGRLFRPLSDRLFNTPAMGAWPALQAATDHNAMPGGFYGPQQWGGIRGPSGPVSISAKARDRRLGRSLWEMSVALTDIDPRIAAHV